MMRSRFSFDALVPDETTRPVIEHALDANENALGPSPLALDAMAKGLTESHCYPDNATQKLRMELARLSGVTTQQIVCGAGSNELIRLAAEVFVGPNQSALAPKHSFRMLSLRMGQLSRKYIETTTDRFEPDIAQLATAVNSTVGIVYIASPGNPVGSALTLEALTALSDSVTPPAVLLIDEAYSDYIDSPLSNSPGVVLARSRPNVLCLRTFSKIYGLAGLRVGWSVSSANLAHRLNEMRGPYNISLPAQQAALASLADTDFKQTVRRHTAEWRQRIVACFAASGRQAFDTPTNFVLVQLASEGEARALRDHLEYAGIAVKHLDDYSLSHCLRITIGREPAMEALLRHVKSFFSRCVVEEQR